MQNKKKDFLDLALESKMLTAPNVEPSVQPQPMIMIEGAPPDFKYSTTGEYSFGPGDNQNLNPQATYQSNLDKAGDIKADEMALLGSQVSLALDRQENSRKAYEDAVKSLVNKEQPDASQVIRDMRAMSQSRPQEFQVPEEDLFTKAIASLGPALAGLAVGGYAGYKGGGEGGDKSMALYGDQRKQDVANAARMAEERSKRMVGQSQLAQAEAKIMQEADQREIQKLEKVIGFLKEQGQQDTDLYKMAVTEYNKRMMGDKLIGAAKTTADFRQKEVDAVNDMEKAQLSAETQKAVAKENAKGRAKQAMQKPPTEGNLKSANYYGTMVQGLNQYDKFAKRYGNKLPSDQRPNEFNMDYQLLASQEGTQFAGITLQKLKGIRPEHREQISNEIYIIDAILRPKTGAAATVNEYLTYRNAYFGGRTPEEKAQRAARRQQELNNLKVMMGNAPTPEQAVIQEPVQKSAGKSQPNIKEVNGVKYQKVEGGWKRIK